MLAAQIHKVSDEAQASIAACACLEDLNAIRTRYLGKSGILTNILKQISLIEALEDRKAIGQVANSVSSSLKFLFKNKELELAKKEMHSRLLGERVDITLPARPKIYGKLHPISRVLGEIKHILGSLGFSVVYGPDLEDEFHVFDALNTPKHHPARNENDTFYMANRSAGKRVVLRTHTSSVQIRTMENNTSFPIRIISPGKVYRNDWDATHSPMFHQVEGLFVDRNVNMGHLKYCVNYFLCKFFSKTVETRMRASFFPFTEPSAEIDVKNENQEWVEVMGCGMVHPNVLKNVNIDPEKYSGFAFGMGVERMAMLKYGVDDLRNFYGNKLEWLGHYGFHFSRTIL